MKSELQKNLLLDDRSISLSEMKLKYKIVGMSDAIKKICKMIDKVASQDTTVLITGESGTGKELVANAIHMNSKRAKTAFVRVNCAGVHETLVESELFGHRRGSFTGAYADKQGKFQLADSGTLFLDEIGDLSANAQAKILRAIETGEVEKLGNVRLENVNVRIISATNKDLSDLVTKGSFRQDLLHRINVFEIDIPPLRKRPDDILPLAHYFMGEYCGQKGITKKRLTSGAEAILLTHHWPGNVRELRNTVEKITVLVESINVHGEQIADLIKYPNGASDFSKVKTLKQAKACFEKSYILHALWEHGWNISETAKALSVNRSSLYEKINAYGISKRMVNPTICLE